MFHHHRLCADRIAKIIATAICKDLGLSPEAARDHTSGSVIFNIAVFTEGPHGELTSADVVVVDTSEHPAALNMTPDQMLREAQYQEAVRLAVYVLSGGKSDVSISVEAAGSYLDQHGLMLMSYDAFLEFQDREVAQVFAARSAEEAGTIPSPGGGASNMAKVTCAEHGVMPCQYIVCSACSAIYKITAGPPERCACGVRLMPENAQASVREFSARLICTPCATSLLRQRRGSGGQSVGGS
jgi:hypothetical protein